MMELYQNAGFATTRMDARWRQIELTPGEYNLRDAHKRLLDYVEKNNIFVNLCGIGALHIGVRQRRINEGKR
jgi:hypothetical protein